MSMLFTLTVDTEEEWQWGSGWPVERVAVTNIGSLPRFQELCSRHGASVTYFTNYAVMNDPASRRIILELAQQPRVEIGMHVHPWNTPPLVNRGPVSVRETFLRNLPDDLIHSKLTSVYDIFAEYGLKPTSFRGGRYSSGGPIHRFLREKGFIADASVLPFNTWDDDGAPDYRQRDLSPVRLPSDNGDHALWEIPLTFGYSRRPFVFWHKVFDRIQHTPLRHLRLIGIADKIGLVRRAWLNFEDPIGRRMVPFINKLRRMRLPQICFTMHSSSLVVGGNGYVNSAAEREDLFAFLDEILSYVASLEDLRPATVSEVAAYLERDYHARSRN